MPPGRPITTEEAPEALILAISAASRLKVPAPPARPIVEAAVEGLSTRSFETARVWLLRVVSVEAVRVRFSAVIVRAPLKLMAAVPLSMSTERPVASIFCVTAMAVPPAALLLSVKSPPVVSIAPRLETALAWLSGRPPPCLRG